MDNKDANASIETATIWDMLMETRAKTAGKIGNRLKTLRTTVYHLPQIKWAALLLYESRSAIDLAERAATVEDLSSEFIAKLLALMFDSSKSGLDQSEEWLVEDLKDILVKEWRRRQIELYSRAEEKTVAEEESSAQGEVLPKTSKNET